MNSVVALKRAAALCDLGKWDDAISHARAVLAIEPHNEEGLHLMARAHHGKDDYGEALRWSLAAISENPESEWAHRLAALASQGLGRHEEARSMAREAVRLAPHTWQCHLVLSQVLAAAGSALHEARAAADRAVELAPHEAGAHLAVGQVAAADGRVEDAKAAFSRALALDPNQSSAHNELGRLTLTASFSGPGSLLGGSGGLAEAAGGFATAVRADPRADVSRRNLDLVLEVALERQARAILLVAWLAMLVGRLSDAGPARVIPTLLLAFPALFALRFAFTLPRQSRGYLRRFLLRLPIAGAVAGDLIAVTLLVAGASFPRVTSVAFGCAVAFALLARAIMWQRTWRRLEGQGVQGRPRIVTTIKLVAVELLLLAIPMFIAVSISAYPNPDARRLIGAWPLLFVLIGAARAGRKP